jgi:hypothetical protein
MFSETAVSDHKITRYLNLSRHCENLQPKIKLRGFSPQANYIVRATADCRRS